MNESTPEIGFRVARLPEGDLNAPAYVIDARGVMRRASEAEAWLWDELVKAKQSRGPGRPRMTPREE